MKLPNFDNNKEFNDLKDKMGIKHDNVSEWSFEKPYYLKKKTYYNITYFDKDGTEQHFGIAESKQELDVYMKNFEKQEIQINISQYQAYDYSDEYSINKDSPPTAKLYSIKASNEWKTKEFIVQEIMQTSKVTEEKAITYFHNALDNNKMLISDTKDKNIKEYNIQKENTKIEPKKDNISLVKENSYEFSL